MCWYIFDYKNIFDYKKYIWVQKYFIGGWGGCGLTSTLCICILLLKVKCCILVDDYRIAKTPVELPTFLFNGNYRSPSFAFQHQHLSQFSAVHYLVTTVKFFKTIFRLNVFNLPIDHLHKLIVLQVDYCLLKSPKMFELNWFNVAITTTGRLSYCFLKSGGNANICILNVGVCDNNVTQHRYIYTRHQFFTQQCCTKNRHPVRLKLP